MSLQCGHVVPPRVMSRQTRYLSESWVCVLVLSPLSEASVTHPTPQMWDLGYPGNKSHGALVSEPDGL